MKTKSMLFVGSALLLQGGCVTQTGAGTVLGSAAAGATIGALGGAALGAAPYNYRYGYGYPGYGHYPNRSDMAVTGALAGAAIGGAIGLAAVSQPVYTAPVTEYRVINRYPVVNYSGYPLVDCWDQTAYGCAYNYEAIRSAKEGVLQYQLEHCNQFGLTSCNPW